MKVGQRDGKILKAVPEYEDVKLAAEKSSMPLRDIIKMAEREVRESTDGGRVIKPSKERPGQSRAGGSRFEKLETGDGADKLHRRRP